MLKHSLAVGMCSVAALFGACACPAEDPWLHIQGDGSGPGAGKKIVLMSGDEEYRSEEALPQLAKILAVHHGFDCTVLFAWNDKAGCIDPTYAKNIPGLEALDSADLLIIFTRFRNLPDEQMRHIDDYLKAGKPVIGIRTSTHAFKPDPGTTFEHYADGYAGPLAEWADGFGRVVLGEHWISHHGEHKHESTRGRHAPGAQGNVILRGIEDGAIWGPTDVYGVRLPLPGDSMPLVLGEVTKRAGEYDENDVFFGMRPEDQEPVAAKNDPMMPIAWTHTYTLPGGKPGKCFASTIGASTDMVNEAVRRMFVNAVYWTQGLEAALPAEGAKVDLVGDYHPSKFEFIAAAEWRKRNLQPAAFAME